MVIVGATKQKCRNVVAVIVGSSPLLLHRLMISMAIIPSIYIHIYIFASDETVSGASVEAATIVRVPKHQRYDNKRGAFPFPPLVSCGA